ncbi:hypothetical protein ABT158_47485 [Nonomuraea sp. NPDC001636]|uniref:hypothetical protein n=1 Tax=Nonomuraea sp. NPDC001636 TaxID=3154391 RepID=UPI00332BD76C
MITSLDTGFTKSRSNRARAGTGDRGHRRAGLGSGGGAARAQALGGVGLGVVEIGGCRGPFDDQVDRLRGQPFTAAAPGSRMGAGGDAAVPVDRAEQRPGRHAGAGQVGEPCAGHPDGAGLRVLAVGDGDDLAVGVLIGLAERDVHLQAVGGEGEVVDVDVGDLRAAAHQGEAEHEDGAVAAS